VVARGPWGYRPATGQVLVCSRKGHGPPRTSASPVSKRLGAITRLGHRQTLPYDNSKSQRLVRNMILALLPRISQVSSLKFTMIDHPFGLIARLD
jgi:hypothetical protein